MLKMRKAKKRKCEVRGRTAVRPSTFEKKKEYLEIKKGGFPRWSRVVYR